MQTRHTTFWINGQGLLGIFLILSLLLGLAACGGGGGSTAAAGSDGQVVIGLTDAEGDFVSYTVDVKSLTLTKASGEVVQALPLTTRVDFAQYTEVTEFLTAAGISSGRYVSASMVLDYSNADIWVEDANGDAVQATNIVDEEGIAIGELTVAVQLEGRNALTIVPGVPAHLTLDFDLKASNVWADNTLTVQPFLQAALEVEKFKTHRMRGPLESVDVATDSFGVILRPFANTLGGNDRRFGDMTVTATDTTVFDIDGNAFTGHDGIVALAAKDLLTPVVVLGAVKAGPLRFEASEVHAGSTVPGGSRDAVSGNVIARNGNTLIVKGATLIRAGGSAVFNDQVTVKLGEMSTVHRQQAMDASYGINDISVGQRVDIFGTLTNDSSTALELDAGDQYAGDVNLQLTILRGTVAPVLSIPEAPQPFAIALQAVDGRSVEQFDFSGTGDVAGNDADPAQYEIDYGSLDVAGFAEGDAVQVRGFVRPFGMAPEDFEAISIADFIAVPSVLAVNWNPVSATALTVESSGLGLNLTGVGKFHHLARGRHAIDLVGFAEGHELSIQIQPEGSDNGLYTINQGGTHQLYTTYAAFADGLNTRLGDGALVKSVSATGQFDDITGILLSRQIRIVLE